MNPTLLIITMVLAGILFVLIEFLLTPGVGIAGFIGLASLIGSCVYAFMVEGSKTGTITTAVVTLVVILTVIWMLRGKSWKKLSLNTEIDSKVNREAESLKIGDEGTTVTRLAPMGTVKFASTTCEAKSEDNSMIAPGTKVVVTAIEENRPIVRTTENR